MSTSKYDKNLLDILGHKFNEGEFKKLCAHLLGDMKDTNNQEVFLGPGKYESYSTYFKSFKNIGSYNTLEHESINVLVVHLCKTISLSRARVAQRNFIASVLSDNIEDAALIAFVSPYEGDWRFSFIRIKQEIIDKKTRETRTHAKRYSFLAGPAEGTHTAQEQLLQLLHRNTQDERTLDEIEKVFGVEKVTEEFFNHYHDLLIKLIEELDDEKNKHTKEYFNNLGIDVSTFAKKLLGQIVFLYFLQKKGWLGVSKDDDWGNGSKKFIRDIFDGEKSDNFFKDILEPLFYEALNTKRDGDYFELLKCRIPFLNGGLFEPYGGYEWQKIDIQIPDDIFSSDDNDGILDIFDIYNFTVDENTPLDKEVAIDPEMLGKIFESLLDEDIQKGSGAYYTPREIVHYMCQESLILYLYGKIDQLEECDLRSFIKDENILSNHSKILDRAGTIDKSLGKVTVCDPAVGSGAFPVEMINLITDIRMRLRDYVKDNKNLTPYDIKLHAIKNSIYGIDIDAGAVEIAKLRLWLTLVVDEENPTMITPLPNLDYKIIKGNSLVGDAAEDIFKANYINEFIKLKENYFLENDNEKKYIIKNKIEFIRSKLISVSDAVEFKVDFAEIYIEGVNSFDIFIGNPPYIREQGNKEFFDIVRNSPLKKFGRGRMDYFYFFFHLALNETYPSSVISFITTNYYISADGAINLRNDMWERSSIKKLVNFNEIKIFNKALGQHNMITILTRSSDKDYNDELDKTEIILAGHSLRGRDKVIKLLSKEEKNASYFYLSKESLYSKGRDKYIRMIESEEKHEDILRLIPYGGIDLGQILRISKGIVTGSDFITEKYLKNHKLSGSIGDGIFVLSDDEIKQINPNNYEKELIKPWFKGSSIYHYYAEIKSNSNLLYITKETDYKKIPNLKKHLDKFQNFLSRTRQRSFTEKEKSRYCDLDQPRQQKVYEGAKIIVPYRSKYNLFAYNENHWYANGDTYFMKQWNDNFGLDIKYILALLNSRLCYFWLYYMGKRKGNVLELYSTPLKKVRIKKIDKEDQKEFINITDNILTLSKDPKLMNQLDRDRIVDYHEKINQMVYKLYGLSKEQIEVVDNLAKQNGVYDLYTN